MKNVYEMHMSFAHYLSALNLLFVGGDQNVYTSDLGASILLERG